MDGLQFDSQGKVTEYKKRSKELMKISTPLMVEQAFITSMSMVNTIMASYIGAYAVSAIGMIDAISNLVIALFATLTTGGTIVLAQYAGRREALKAKHAASQSIVLSLAFSIVVLLFILVFNRQLILFLYDGAEPQVLQAAIAYSFIICFSYPALAVTQTIFGILRGLGNTGIPMVVSIIMNVSNVILGFVLIFGLDFSFFGLFQVYLPSLGVMGAALALLLARIIGLLISGWYIVFVSKTLRLNRISLFKPNLEVQKQVLKIGLPTGVESTLFQIGKLVIMTFIVSLGTAAITANTIGGNVFALINAPGAAFSTASMILIGQRIGRGETEDVINTDKFVSAFCAILLGILCLIFFLMTDFFIALYKTPDESVGYLKQILYSCYIIMPIFWASSFITPSSLRATGDVKYTMYVSVISMFIFRITFSYILGIVMDLGILGIWIGMYFDWVARGIAFVLRIRKGRWKGKAIR